MNADNWDELKEAITTRVEIKPRGNAWQIKAIGVFREVKSSPCYVIVEAPGGFPDRDDYFEALKAARDNAKQACYLTLMTLYQSMKDPETIY